MALFDGMSDVIIDYQASSSMYRLVPHRTARLGNAPTVAWELDTYSRTRYVLTPYESIRRLLTMLDSSDIADFNETTQYKEPTDNQKRIVDHLVSTNEKIAEASESLDMDRCNIYRELRKTHVKHYMYRCLVDRMTLSSVRAVNQLDKLIDHTSGYISLEASKEVLNRVGIVTVERKQVQVSGQVNVNIDLS